MDEIDRVPADTVDILSWNHRKTLWQKSSENFSLYGAEKLENLLTHFSCNVSAEEARSEFVTQKQIMISSDPYASCSFQQFARL